MNGEGSCIAAFSFLAFVLLIPPFAYHRKQGNIPACSLIFWLCYENLVSFVNAIIWSSEDFDTATTAPGYCDLTVRITSGASSGKLASIATVMFNLYMIIRAENHKFLEPKSKRRLITNIAMCWATSLFVMSTSIIVQATRYVIFRYRGCLAAYAYSYLTLILVQIWNLIWSAIALVFALLTLITYVKKRRDIGDILRCTGSGLNNRRFARLVIFSLLIIFVLVPFAVYNFVNAADTFGVASFNLSKVHNEYWSTIYTFDYGTSQLASPIINICLAAVTFLLFGLGTDALSMYRRFLHFLGFKRFSKFADEHPMISPEFTESKCMSRETALTEGTLATMHELKHYKELVFGDSESPFDVPSTIKDGKDVIRISNDDNVSINFDDQISYNTDIAFDFRVVPK
ncbi:hypothetical_protein [Candidozyma auris]|uniref:hypothetical_protein n=1 Tax=Candidozyma auris TaxID=498019 RepID=UPI000D2B6E68|nr:hypothetical_protein [[Candida] auris]QEO22986.1 hypothetical_protein [[Candida] auris]